jgi:hypothetical protein
MEMYVDGLIVLKESDVSGLKTSSFTKKPEF